MNRDHTVDHYQVLILFRVANCRREIRGGIPVTAREESRFRGLAVARRRHAAVIDQVCRPLRPRPVAVSIPKATIISNLIVILRLAIR